MILTVVDSANVLAEVHREELLPIGRIHGNEPGVYGAEQDAALAGLRILPRGNAAGDKSIARFILLIGLWIEDPLHFARCRIDSIDPVERRRKVENTVHHDWRRLKSRWPLELFVIANVAVVNGPDGLQLGHVAFVDFGEL